jgi:hypothetical protein
VKSIFNNINFIPINKTAGIVTSAGFEFTPIKSAQNCFKDIPKIIDKNHSRVGETFGRFTVIGLYEHKQKCSHKFVVRCICGNYSITTGIRINRAQKNKKLLDVSMCDECDYLIYIRNGKSHCEPVTKRNRNFRLKKQTKE